PLVKVHGTGLLKCAVASRLGSSPLSSLERKCTARASSRKVRRRSGLPRTAAAPPPISISAGEASRRLAATRLIRSPRRPAARRVAAPPMGIPRLAQVPPPYGRTDVAPERTDTPSIRTPPAS